MTHEQFIEPKTAELAKQAGFDWESRFDNQQQRDEWQQVALVEVSNPDYNDAMGDPYSDEFIPFMSPTKFVMLPHVTQSVLQRWLREVKGISVEVCHVIVWVESGTLGIKWCYRICYLNSNKSDIPSSDEFNTYEAALEAGSQKYLTLIIEKQ